MTNAGVAAAIDHTNGLHDRFATMPLPAWVPGAARTVNEMVFTLARGALLLAVGADDAGRTRAECRFAVGLFCADGAVAVGRTVA